MTDQLNKSLERLRAISPELNRVTDQANAAVAAIEKFLNEECSIGIAVRVTVQPVLGKTSLMLAYERIGGKFRIAVVGDRLDVDSTGHESWSDVFSYAWSEAPRGEKLATFPKLPELIANIATEAEAAISKTDEAASAVNTVMQALARERSLRGTSGRPAPPAPRTSPTMENRPRQ